MASFGGEQTSETLDHPLVTWLTILGPQLDCFHQIKLIHDLEKPVYLRSVMLIKLAGEGRLLISFKASSEEWRQPLWRTFIIDTKRGKLHRLKLKSDEDDQGKGTDFRSDVFWATDQGLMVYHLASQNQQNLGIYHVEFSE